MGITKSRSRGKPSQSAAARNVRNERINGIYDIVGVIAMFSGPSASIPPGWLLCDGSEVLISGFPELYALIGTTYGAAGTAGYFKLPDMANYVPIGVKASTGLCTALAGTFAVDATTAATDHTYLGLYFIIRAY